MSYTGGAPSTLSISSSLSFVRVLNLDDSPNSFEWSIVVPAVAREGFETLLPLGFDAEWDCSVICRGRATMGFFV